MKKILIFTHEFPPRLGGAGGVALQLAEYFVHNDYDVTLVTQKRKNTLKYDFKIIQIPIVSKLWFISYFIFFKFHNLNQYDRIIVNDGGAIYSAGLSFSEKNLLKSIVYIHGLERYLSQSSVLLKVINFKRNYMRTLNKSLKIITVSNFIKDIFFKDELQELLPKVHTIHNGVDIKQFHYIDNNKLEKFNIEQNDIVLVSISRLVKQKGYLTKLNIFKNLLQINKNYKWFIIGDGDLKNKFQEIIKDENLENNVFLLGKKERTELKYYLSKADFFWLLSDLEESFGLVYLEAMACKCIPIGWNKAGVKEVIQNSINGYLADSTVEVIEFIRNGYKQIDREKLPNNVIRIEDTYNKVLL